MDRASSAGRFARGEPASGATKSSEALAPAGEAVPSRGARGGEKRLVAVAGPHMGTEFRLTGTGVAQVIGRDPANGVALPGDTKASRAHARVSGSGGAGWIVEDAGSTNGTFVNGQRVTRQELVSGDTILIGTTALRFE
ncbi:MAG: FHA domain-containing protein [Cytophagales bacterium]|nr:FHA domain-containing protein [Armatimonadota bacterium]